MKISVRHINGVFEPLEEVKDFALGEIYQIDSDTRLDLSMSKKRILIIDDEEGLTRTLKLYLEGTGRYEVRIENRGSQGLEAAQDFKPDLIFLDIIMPDQDGGALAAAIRSDLELADTPIVFLTALVSKKQVGDHGKTIGGHPFLAKPVDPDRLVEAIESYATRS